jgi:hypothetical protein
MNKIKFFGKIRRVNKYNYVVTIPKNFIPYLTIGEYYEITINKIEVKK